MEGIGQMNRPTPDEIAEARTMLNDAMNGVRESYSLNYHGLEALRVLIVATAPTTDAKSTHGIDNVNGVVIADNDDNDAIHVSWNLVGYYNVVSIETNKDVILDLAGIDALHTALEKAEDAYRARIAASTNETTELVNRHVTKEAMLSALDKPLVFRPV
jgi:hypothetical protein